MSLDRLDNHRLRLLFELGRSFAEQTDFEALVRSVVTSCRDIFDVAGGVAVLLLDPETNQFCFPYVAARNPEHAERIARLRIPAQGGIAGAVLESGRAELVPNAQRDPRYFRGVDEAIGFTTGAVLAAPISSRRGMIGVIYVAEREGGRSFDHDDLVFLESLAGSVGLAIENARMYDRMRIFEEDLRTQVGTLRRDLERRDRFTEIVGSSAAVRELIRLMESAAGSPIPVLIEGETGTGKELVARGVHRASERAGGPFYPVNCGAVPEALLESELFGYERGAFTGADREKRGLLESASGGSILLDEVEEMPPAMQVRLLRVLQEGEVLRVGSTRGRSIDVRVISASNRVLEDEVANGRFREDLYYRLCGFPIHVPPLRERREDIPALIDHLLHAATANHEKRIGGIEPAARELLQLYDWPGNVRELKNEIERAVALSHEDEMIGAYDFSERVLAAAGPAYAAGRGESRGAAAGSARRAGGSPRDVTPLREARAAFEARYIGEVLEREGGNVSRAADALGISRVMLHKKLKVLGLR